VSVQSRAFLRLFQAEVQAGLSDEALLRRTWNSSSDWTAFMLGSGPSRASSDPTFGVVGRVGISLGYRVSAEYLRVDQIWYVTDPEDERDWRIEAFVEHENDPKRVGSSRV